jgi:hypothetical protein
MGAITTRSTVAALVPHFRCERWLAGCLQSLLEQTRPLDAIIVLDDASDEPPTDIVARHPGVTLLRADRNVGPYRLIQQAIEDFAFDAFLFQDADDWSARDRLERLLATAERDDAELVGSFEVRVLCDERDVQRVRYPTDVNRSLRDHPQGFPLLHPTSLVARSLVERLGGFASGMRFSGDAEFLRRAGHVARIVNVPEYLYFRRKRQGALTTSAETGLGAPAREKVQAALRERALYNAELVRAGAEPDLAPMSVAPPVRLELLCGPDVSSAASSVSSTIAESTVMPFAGGAPVVVVGPPRSGVELVAWSLGQAHDLRPALDVRWMPPMLRSALEAVDAAPARDERDRLRTERLEAIGRDIVSLLSPGRARIVIASSELCFDLPAIARAFPASPIIVLERRCEDVVAAMQSYPSVDGAHLSPLAARDLCRRASAACREAAASLGSYRVSRMSIESQLANPDSTLRALDH